MIKFLNIYNVSGPVVSTSARFISLDLQKNPKKQALLSLHFYRCGN